MVGFSLGERYRLELHWENVVYEQPGICKIVGACFSGPALNEAQKLNDIDSILLDFYSQYITLVDRVYVAKFSWEGVCYNSSGTITLKNAVITHDSQLNRVPKLKNEDYLVIDTSDHILEKHAFAPAYKTYVVNEDTNLYRFGDR